MTPQGLQRVIDATDLAASVDRNALLDDLNYADSFYHTALDHRSESARRSLDKNLNSIAKLAKKLQFLLENPDTWREIADYRDRRSISPRLVIAVLVKASEAALKPKPRPMSWDVELGEELAADLGIGKLSPFEWLAGDYLLEIFEKHFLVKGTPRRADGLCDTPYIRFAGAVLLELKVLHNGKPYAAESIARAMSLAKKPRRN